MVVQNTGAVSLMLTLADGSVASVAGLAGAAVSSHHVETQSVLVTVVHSTQALVMLCRETTRDTTPC